MGEYMGSCSTTEAAHTDKMGKGQNEGEGGGFSEDQIQMYKDCFKLMDINKDGTLDKNDLRGAFDNIGVLMSESELDDLMGEVGGPCNVTGMINMFQEKMAGDGNDPDELILQAFMAYDLVARSMSRCSSTLSEPGETRCPTLRLTTFEQFDVDEDYMVKTKEVVGLFVAVKEEEKKEEKKEEVVEAAPEEEGDDAKKKKKKKKAAK